MPKNSKIVLVGVIRRKKDLDILLAERWYRIPKAKAPKQKFDYLAFYEPSYLGRRPGRIRYYTRVLSCKTLRRIDLLPDEVRHPRARNHYLRFRVGKIRKLPRPVKNTTPRRVSFGFTALRRLLNSRNILELYGVALTEQMIGDGLKQAGIKAVAQHYVSIGRKRYCLDFAVFCRRGMIAIECDNKKAHSGRRERERDKTKDAALKRRGWTVIRLPEEKIVADLDGCILKVKKSVRNLGDVT